MSTGFIHLNVHSEYSLVDSVVRIPQLLDETVSQRSPAVALTDKNNLFAAVKFYKAALQRGVKPILGVDLDYYLDDDPQQLYSMILLCQNDQGYKNLTRLVSRAYLEGQAHGSPRVARTWLSEASTGLLALSGATQGDIAVALLANDQRLARQRAESWQADFPDRFYIEIRRSGLAEQGPYIQAAIDLAQQLDLPIVASNAVRFISADDFEAHEARVCINQGYVLEDNSRPRLYNDQQYLCDPHTMQSRFADLPEALANTYEIAKRCNLQLKLGDAFLPEFPVPQGMSVESYLEQLAAEGLAQRLAHLTEIPDNYTQRLKRELQVINNMGFPGYFLIVADFIQWAKQNRVPVGPGRGSGAGSLVAYALQITDLDPLEHALLFERFLNPERVSMPDFDIDFCMDKRDSVIEYVAQKYGRNNVSQIITYGTMAARAVLRDVGRVLGYPYGFVDKLVKLMPFELGMTLEKAFAQEEMLQQRYENEDDVRTLVDLARKLEGIVRNVGKHAGGLVIAPTVLTDFAPLYCEAGGGNLVTQFDKDDIESVGLVKFDFLGLRTLTIIDWAMQTINKQRVADDQLDITRIPIDDAKTFTLLRSCATTAVFQLESRGMKDLIKRLQPDRFDEVTALVALFRPGPLQSGMVDDFIDRKHGRAKVEYPHPEIASILQPTYGVILYQEQVMQIAQVLAGYSLGEADLLRRAMGKKKPEEMARQRSTFVEGATKRGVEQETASYIFDLMEKFAGYGFNKSHSVAYALIAYQTAWLKAHYPAEFMAAVLSADLDNTDKIVTLIDECRNMGLTILPPTINQSAYPFTVNEDGDIVYGLGAIKGVGEAAIAEMLSARRQGEFKDLFDLCQRVTSCSRRTLEALVRAGALDALGPHRAALLLSVDKALQAAEQNAQNQAHGMVDLFASVQAPLVDAQHLFVEAKPWDESQRLQAEKESLGLYLSGHPINRYTHELSQLVSCEIAQLQPEQSRTIVLAGLLVALRTMQTKRGERMAFLTLDDRSGRIEIALFPDVYTANRELLEKDTLLIVEGDVSVDDYSGGYKLACRQLYTLDSARAQFGRALCVQIDAQQIESDFTDQLRATLQPFCSGPLPVLLDYRQGDVRARVSIDDAWRVTPSEALCKALALIPGCSDVSIIYPNKT